MEKSLEHAGQVEVRGLLFLKRIFDERNWSFPHYIRLETSCSSKDFAELLELPMDKIEAVFINGKAHPLEDGWVNPGDRVTFLSPGTPGPHRFLLGIARIPDDK